MNTFTPAERRAFASAFIAAVYAGMTAPMTDYWQVNLVGLIANAVMAFVITITFLNLVYHAIRYYDRPALRHSDGEGLAQRSVFGPAQQGFPGRTSARIYFFKKRS